MTKTSKMTVQLTTGFAAQVFSSPDTPEGLEPTLQVLSVKKINAQNATANTADRYRSVLLHSSAAASAGKKGRKLIVQDHLV